MTEDRYRWQLVSSHLRWWFPSFMAAACCAVSIPLLFSWTRSWIFAPFSTLAGAGILTVFLHLFRKRRRVWLAVVGTMAAASTAALCTMVLLLPQLSRPVGDAVLLTMTALVARYASFLGLGLLLLHGLCPALGRIPRCLGGVAVAGVAGIVFVVHEAAASKTIGDFRFPFLFSSPDLGWSVRMVVLAIILGASYSVFLPSDRSAPEADGATP